MLRLSLVVLGIGVDLACRWCIFVELMVLIILHLFFPLFFFCRCVFVAQPSWDAVCNLYLLVVIYKPVSGSAACYVVPLLGNQLS